mmetsp:Transcript_34445/g.87697  ORF Transcript_34445/g.87697 Transcript_34445/m.87697 type:complete len:205 (+) Transcript_34445:81-695(+)
MDHLSLRAALQVLGHSFGHTAHGTYADPSISLRAVRAIEARTSVVDLPSSTQPSTSMTPLGCPIRSAPVGGLAMACTMVPGRRAAAVVATEPVTGYALCNCCMKMQVAVRSLGSSAPGAGPTKTTKGVYGDFSSASCQVCTMPMRTAPAPRIRSMRRSSAASASATAVRTEEAQVVGARPRSAERTKTVGCPASNSVTSSSSGP